MRMKIAVIGAGAVGVTTAHALSKAGCEVHVFEQASSAAQGASFAHSGLFGQMSVAPFFGATFAKQLFVALMGRSSGIHWSAFTTMGHYALALKAAWLARRKNQPITHAQLARLARYSASVAAGYLSEEAFAFEQGTGLMVIHTQMAAFEAASLSAKVQNSDITVSHEKIKILTPEQACEYQTALAKHTDIVGAIVYPSEAYGNCALFTKQLKLSHQQQGVHYWFNTQVSRLEPQKQQWTVHTASKTGLFSLEDTQNPLDAKPSSDERFDAIVVAAGTGSADLILPLGLRFPLLNTHAYAVTLPCQERMDSPHCTVLDAASGHVITPIGNRIRISGLYHLGKLSQPGRKAYKALNEAVQQWFPFACKVSQASYDISTSCIAVDSKPVVGLTELPGLWLNFAHGPAHWALSFACAQAICDGIMNEANAFDLSPFSPKRFL